MKTKSGPIGSSFSTTDFPDLINQPGVFMSIPITSLRIDSEYQRGLIGSRVDKISNDWSWVACGCVLVALRGAGSGEYYVIDGQHRVAAAERANIPELPCLVFESLTHVDEAQGFLSANTSRRVINIIDRYRAMLVIGDPIALKVKRLLDIADRAPAVAVNYNDGKSVKCLEFLMSAVSLDEETVEKIWPLMITLCEGRLISKRILQGIFYLERFLTNTSTTDRHWKRRFLQVGYDSIVKSINETVAFEGKAGSAVCCQGVLRALNHGLRNKLKVEKTTTTTIDETT
jgi:ParB-like nuclease domain